MRSNLSIISIVLISIGVISGYGGILFSGYMFVQTCEKYWVWAGSIVYAISWVPYGIGLLLISRKTFEKIRKRLKSFFDKDTTI